MLVTALERNEVLCHPFVVGEIALGSLKNRREILERLADLPQAEVVEDAELHLFIERHKLMGRGIRLVDVHLMCAAHLCDAELITRDKRLAAALFRAKR
jgi:hypothetical protein